MKYSHYQLIKSTQEEIFLMCLYASVNHRECYKLAGR
jgi:hypothetical protein